MAKTLLKKIYMCKLFLAMTSLYQKFSGGKPLLLNIHLLKDEMFIKERVKRCSSHPSTLKTRIEL